VAARVSPALRSEDRANHEKGRRLLAAGDAKGALRALTEVARRFPGNHAVVHDYGIALVRGGEQELGIFQLEHASRLAPGIGSYRFDLIRALLAAGHQGFAARELGELLARDPTNLEAAELLARITEARGTADGAASPGPVSMDLGGAPGSASGPGPADGGATFTNNDLARRPAAPRAAVMPSRATAAPNVSPPALRASPSPPG
jgi:predicted Zn-dependent protease